MRVSADAEAQLPPVRVDVLGPLQLTVGREVVEVPGPKRRALLALLAMADSQAVPVDDIVDALWPRDPPATARASLQSHVSRLRGHLGRAAPRLEGLTGAYRLRLDDPADGSDIDQARSLLAAAGAAAPVEARALLGEARARWRGTPLAEFSDVPPLAAWAVTLDELRRTVDEAQVTAALNAGATGEAVELATALVAADPLSESPVLLLMRALAAAGRSTAALRAGHEHRRRLATETGLEPSDQLRELERQIAGATGPRELRPPRPANPLRGRDSELAALHRLLEREHLVTVLGPGGVGKTRLALELTARADDATALMLAPVTGAEAIPHSLADALGLRVVRDDVLAACASLLAAGPRLLLVDNCEHLLPGVADVVAALLDACPDLTVLATSREPLGVAAEQRLRVATLPLAHRSDHDPPDDRDPDGLDDLVRSPAVAVFLDRARRVRPDFAPGPKELALVEEIVRRLDGLPLAIELAAGRLSSLDLADLRARLDRSLDLLGDGRLTLRRTLEWSYDLLPKHEQRLFRHLGAFPGGFDLATAEAVGAALDLPVDAAGALAHLVDTSMVEAVPGDPMRYRMLDTMRTFARDRLEAHAEDHAAAELFVRWALDLVVWVDRTVATSDEADADRRLRRELPNLRAVWRICREQGRIDESVRLVVGLSDAAGWRDLTEVWAWELELADDPALPAHPDARLVLGLAAGSAWARGDLARAERLVAAGYRHGGGASCLASSALIALSRGDLADTIELGRKAAEMAKRPDQSLGLAALAAAYSGRLDVAAALATQLAAISPSPTISAFAEYVAAETDALAGRTQSAERRYEQAITLSRASGASFVDGIASVGLVTVRASAGRVADALDGYRDLVDYWERTGGWIQQWTTLRNLARLLRTLGDTETALFLEAAAHAAPDAPADGAGDDEGDSDGRAHLPDEVSAEAAIASRSSVLQVARDAIARHRVSPADLPPSARAT